MSGMQGPGSSSESLRIRIQKNKVPNAPDWSGKEKKRSAKEQMKLLVFFGTIII